MQLIQDDNLEHKIVKDPNRGSQRILDWMFVEFEKPMKMNPDTVDISILNVAITKLTSVRYCIVVCGILVMCI
jgi:hypothetical protein